MLWVRASDQRSRIWNFSQAPTPKSLLTLSEPATACFRSQPVQLGRSSGRERISDFVSFPKRNFPKNLRTPTVREVDNSTSSVVYSQFFEVFTEMGSWGEKLGWRLIASIGIPESDDQTENCKYHQKQCLLVGKVDISSDCTWRETSTCRVTFLWKTTLHDHHGKCNNHK